MNYITFDSTGAIASFITNQNAIQTAVQNALEIDDATAASIVANFNGFYVDGGVVKPIPASPGTAYAWDWPSKTWVLNLTAGQAAALARLKAACDAACVAGYTSNALGATYTYPSTPTDQLNMTVAVTDSLLPNLAAGWTTPFWCVDSNGVWEMRQHTAAQIQQAGSDGKATVQAVRVKLATLSAQVMAATTHAELDAVQW